MIGPGCLPRPFGRLKKRTLAYTRPRRRNQKKRAGHGERVHHEVVIFDRRNALPFARAYVGWRARVALNTVQGKRYQQNGAYAHRGEAAPQLGGHA